MTRRLFRVGLILVAIQAALLAIAVLAKKLVREWGDRDSEEVQVAAILDGRELRSRAGGFRGGTVIACYGGVELDLRDAVPAPGGTWLRLIVVFGGVSILVPDGWRVTMKGSTFLGGVEQRTTSEDELPDGAPELTVEATTFFGGVAVRAKALSSKAA